MKLQPWMFGLNPDGSVPADNPFLGGDELNLIKAGGNYGWPVICYGIDYPGTKVGAGITQQAAVSSARNGCCRTCRSVSAMCSRAAMARSTC